MTLPAKLALFSVLVVANSAAASELHAAELMACEDPPSGTRVALEFHSGECKLISYDAIKKIYPSVAAAGVDPAAVLPGFAGFFGIRIGLDGTGAFSARLYPTEDCSGNPVVTMPATATGSCGQLEAAVPGAEMPRVRVTRAGPSWMTNTLYALPDAAGGNVTVKGLKASQGSCSNGAESDDAAGLSVENGACIDVDLTAMRLQAAADPQTQPYARLIPDEVHAGLTCYDGVARVRGGPTDCSGGMLTPKGVPEFGVEVPTVDVPWGQCTDVYVKLHTYAVDMRRSLRIVLPVKVSVDRCEFVAAGADGAVKPTGATFAPLPPASQLATLPPRAAGDADAPNDEAAGGLATWVIVVIAVVPAVLCLAAVAAVVVSRRKAAASFSVADLENHMPFASMDAMQPSVDAKQPQGVASP